MASAGGLAWIGCPAGGAGHSAVDWLAATVLYLPFVALLAVFQRTAAWFGVIARSVGALLVASVLLHFLRTQTDLVHLASQPIAALALWGGMAILALLVPPPAGGPVAARGFRRISAAGVLVTLLLLATALAPTVRWHLFAHQPFLATLVVHLHGNLPAASPQAVLEASELELRHDPGRAIPADPTRPADAPPPPSIVLVVIDTLRADALGAYGAREETMPALERFARRSLVLTDAWANSTWTRPSVASALTGLLPEHLGVLDEDDRLPESATTLAEHLAAAGYETAAFMSNPHLHRRWGFAQGFEHFREIRGPHAYPRASRVRGEVERWLSARAVDAGPAFLYIHFMDPHTPYLGEATAEKGFLGQYDRDAYRAELRYLDRHLGRLLAGLETSLGESTAVLVTSDHGEEFGEHGGWGHGHTVYPELARVPFVLRAPGAGTATVDAPVQLLDVFGLVATIARGEGDLRSVIEERRPGARSVSTYKTPRSRMVRLLRPWSVIRVRGVERDGRLTVWNGFGLTTERYDLTLDPTAHHNLAPAASTAAPPSIDDAVGHWRPPDEGVLRGEHAEELRSLGYL